MWLPTVLLSLLLVVSNILIRASFVESWAVDDNRRGAHQQRLPLQRPQQRTKFHIQEEENAQSTTTCSAVSSGTSKKEPYFTTTTLWQQTSTSSSLSSSSPSKNINTDSKTTATTLILNRKPIAGDVVTIDCQLVPEGDFVPEPLVDGIVLHPDDPPVRLSFVLHQGNYLPGLHDVVATLEPGETATNISLDAGWGDRNPQLEATITYAASGLQKDQIRVSVQLVLENGLKAVVTATTDADFTMDANPPLAGASYAATVTLVSVEAGLRIDAYREEEEENDGPSSDNEAYTAPASRYQVATFALGCFWGAELEFMRMPGVLGTAVGYTQGHDPQPTYEQVCSGTTGHTEAVAITYDPEVVSYAQLVHLAMDRLGENKYLLNQVDNDQGTQYRHGVYYHTPAQKAVAEAVLATYGTDCVTECRPATEWYPAEDYHQQYLLKGGQSARKGDGTAIRCYG